MKCYLDLVPRPTTEEYTVLKESLILEGQKDPIVINSKGIILDGHTRYEILTDIGKKMSDYPLDPLHAKIVLAASTQFNCVSEALTIVAMLNVPNIYIRPRNQTELADSKKS